MIETVRGGHNTSKEYYCLLEDYTCDAGAGENCEAGSAEGRDARTRDPSKCPYRIEKTW
jgi:hypothetical protein